MGITHYFQIDLHVKQAKMIKEMHLQMHVHVFN